MSDTKIGFGAATSVVIGSVIGSGIFILPALMTTGIPAPLWVLGAFLAGGLISLCGALTLAELGGMYPQEGGQAVYLEKTMGRPFAFLFGWTSFWVIQCGVIAAVSLAFGRFAGVVFGYDDAITTAFVAVACIGILTLANAFGLRQGSAVQVIFTIAKTLGIAVLVVAAFVFFRPDHSWLGPVDPGAAGLDLVSVFGLAALAGIFAYDGWYVVTYIAGEIKKPQRNVPLALGVGMAVITLVYMITVLAYFWVLPADDVAAIGNDGNSRIAAEVARTVMGGAGATFMAVVVMISTFGGVNGYILTSPRLFAGLARDGLMWRAFGNRSKKTNVPMHGLVYQAEWSALLVMISIFAADAYLALVNTIVFGLWFWFTFTAIGYFRARRLFPDHPRPYRTTGYPVVPGLFLLAGIGIVVNLAIQDIRLAMDIGFMAALPNMSSFWGTVLIVLGTPFLARIRAGGEGPAVEAGGRDAPIDAA